jgi:antiviral helicase SKI2
MYLLVFGFPYLPAHRRDPLCLLLDLTHSASPTYLPSAAGPRAALQAKEEAAKLSKPGGHVAMRGGGGKGGGKGGGGNAKNDRNEWTKLLKDLDKDTLLPVVVFSFSKKKCEEVGRGLTSMQLNTNVEKSEVPTPFYY